MSGPNYFEVDVDITSNTVANSVTSLVVGAITSLVVDLAPLVEGQVRAQLPWCILRVFEDTDLVVVDLAPLAEGQVRAQLLCLLFALFSTASWGRQTWRHSFLRAGCAAHCLLCAAHRLLLALLRFTALTACYLRCASVPGFLGDWAPHFARVLCAGGRRAAGAAYRQRAL